MDRAKALVWTQGLHSVSHQQLSYDLILVIVALSQGLSSEHGKM